MNLTNRQKMIAGVTFGLLIVGVAGLLITSRFAASGDSRSHVDQEDRLPRLPAMRIYLQDSFLRKVGHSGTVHPRQRTMVAFQRGGMVEELLVDEGQQVEAAADLARLDLRQLTAQAESLQARLAQANSVLTELRRGPRAEDIAAARATVDDLQQQLNAQSLRLERSQSLMDSNSIPRQEYERELYAEGALKARLQAAQSQLDELEAGTRLEQIEAQEALVRSIEADQKSLQHEIEDCLLQAPFAGMIVSRLIDSGAVVAAGTPVFELIDNRNLEVHIGVPSGTAAQMQPGHAYSVETDTGEISGQLRTVLPIVESATRTRKAILDVTLDTGSSALIAGQLVRVELPEQIDAAGFWIPASALTADHRGLWTCLVVEPDGGETNRGVTRKQSVEILYQQDEQVFVRGTLQDGQILVSDGVQRIVAGQQIMFDVTAPIQSQVTSTGRLER